MKQFLSKFQRKALKSEPDIGKETAETSEETESSEEEETKQAEPVLENARIINLEAKKQEN